ncbi:putative O-methyltransferase [Aaosphaeria arxii CBS 175.79]|uniref:Putative O-methyltransferase n=1 Tax=Aaosphaeria arxii CBS 175.79 TaxID=1450172 RepID=A0A6A5XNW6_9PLEO|nr:putative O-methyltransferase [Aaosphaeria arxii CBS 175.79]KAF2014420.1 putative O-methyltransferase [Aaosphaeria arxii CBS 175.79]
MADIILQKLIVDLKSALQGLRSDITLQKALHNENALPDKALSGLSSEALDLLSEARLELEPSQMVLADHFMGYMSTKALCAAVDLNLPDIMRAGPVLFDNLCEAANARPDRLRQIMRTLVNNGVFSYDPTKDLYQNNRASQLLLSDHWTQWRNWVDLYGNEFYDMSRGIPLSCRKDAVRAPAQINFDTDKNMFVYFTEQGWMPKFFKTLSGGAIAMAPGILQDYPWDEVSDGTILDLGGGSGGLIALLLRGLPTLKGGVFDLAKGIEQARINFHGEAGEYKDVGSRVPEENLIIGDFLKEVPSFEIYTMKWCLHDWDDENATTILQNIRRAIRKTPLSRLVILESILQDGHTGRMSRYGDLNMMVAVGGRERDRSDWERLAGSSGWRLNRIFVLRNAWPSAIEFVPDWDWTQGLSCT